MRKLFPRLIAFLLVPCLIGDPTLAAAFSQRRLIGRPTTSEVSDSCFQQQALTARLIFQPGKALADRILTARILVQLAVSRMKNGVSVVRNPEEIFGSLHSNFVRRHPERFSRPAQFLLWGSMYSAVAWGFTSAGFHVAGDTSPIAAYATAILMFVVSYKSARWLDSLRKQGDWSNGLAVLASPVLVLLLIGHLAYNIIPAALFGAPFAQLPQDPPLNKIAAALQKHSLIQRLNLLQAERAGGLSNTVFWVIGDAIPTNRAEDITQFYLQHRHSLINHVFEPLLDAAVENLAADAQQDPLTQLERNQTTGGLSHTVYWDIARAIGTTERSEVDLFYPHFRSALMDRLRKRLSLSAPQQKIPSEHGTGATSPMTSASADDGRLDPHVPGGIGLQFEWPDTEVPARMQNMSLPALIQDLYRRANRGSTQRTLVRDHVGTPRMAGQDRRVAETLRDRAAMEGRELGPAEAPAVGDIWIVNDRTVFVVREVGGAGGEVTFVCSPMNVNASDARLAIVGSPHFGSAHHIRRFRPSASRLPSATALSETVPPARNENVLSAVSPTPGASITEENLDPDMSSGIGMQFEWPDTEASARMQGMSLRALIQDLFRRVNRSSAQRTLVRDNVGFHAMVGQDLRIVETIRDRARTEGQRLNPTEAPAVGDIWIVNDRIVFVVRNVGTDGNLMFDYSPMNNNPTDVRLAASANAALDPQYRIQRFRPISTGQSQKKLIGAIFYNFYLKGLVEPPTNVIGKTLFWMGNPANSPKWEWVFQAVPVLLTIVAGLSLPSAVMMTVSMALIFAAAHPDKTFTERVQLFGMAIGLTVALTVPGLVISYVMRFASVNIEMLRPMMFLAGLIGLKLNIRSHDLLNRDELSFLRAV